MGCARILARAVSNPGLPDNDFDGVNDTPFTTLLSALLISYLLLETCSSPQLRAVYMAGTPTRYSVGTLTVEPYTWPVPRREPKSPPTPMRGLRLSRGANSRGPFGPGQRTQPRPHFAVASGMPQDPATARLCGSRFGRSSLLNWVTQRRTTGSRRATRATHSAPHTPHSRHTQCSAHPPLAPHTVPRTHPTNATHTAPHTPH